MHKNWLVINLNKKYFLKVGNRVFRCQVGAGGFKNVAKKVEGDKTTPIGKWRLVKLYYRADRVLRPKFKKKNILKIKRITKYCGWCDDIRSNYYNKYLNINNPLSPKIGFEKLWRGDDAYDIVIQISHNTNPTIKNKGSAIFIHCSFEDTRSTAGCIALEKRDLIFLIKNLKSDVNIRIK
jgi:L,D-peptidoglycan transpeptidase YkuD (ErfK/YbiS/YcfS/YnhG family)